jgi:flavin reductase (DIM6/NTAB) family NADH-FMN oxidoreductase RutF
MDEALTAMECRTTAVHDGGDHSIVVGGVLAVTEPRANRAPLLHYAGRYRRLRG